ncbi:MAG: histidine phosphatase family protein [Patescibacteria group bacterium]|mgnify:CR=1 FL=1
MKIYFARHGRTNYNDLELCNADPSKDVHITPTGEEQAKTLAQRLKDVPIERIYVSELKRTQQTAAIVNKFHGAPIEIAPLLNDHRSGYEGKPATLLMEALDKAEDRWTARFNDGESIDDMRQRVAKFLDELKTKPYDTVLVVTSQWIIHAAVVIIQNISYEEAWKLEVQQGSCIRLEV